MQEDPAADLFFALPNLYACLDTPFAVAHPANTAAAVGRAFAVAVTLEGVPVETNYRTPAGMT